MKFLQQLLALIMLLGFIFLAFWMVTKFIFIAIILGLTLFLIFVMFIGENGHKHTCQRANRCPGAVRCSNEKEMFCYEPLTKSKRRSK